MVCVSVVVPINFGQVLEGLRQADPDWEIWDGRGKSWNWFYFDFTGPFHPSGLWGHPENIRRGEFDTNFTLDPDTLVRLAEEMWVELYDELIWYYPDLSDNLLDAHKSCQVHRHSNVPGSGLLPYLDVALFFYIVGSSQYPLTWVLERP
jgi:hypothetical protein